MTKRQWRILNRLSAYHFDVLQGLTTLRLFGRSREQVDNLERVSRRYGDATMDVLRTAFQTSLVLEWGATIAIALVAVEIGLRLPEDFIKAMALGADAIAVSNAAIQAIGCLGMRACHTNNCPVGIATQKPHLRQRLKVEKGAGQLNNFFRASTELMQVMARACGHDHLNKFCIDDLTTWDREMAQLTGIAYGGVSLTISQ